MIKFELKNYETRYFFFSNLKKKNHLPFGVSAFCKTPQRMIQGTYIQYMKLQRGGHKINSSIKWVTPAITITMIIFLLWASPRVLAWRHIMHHIS